MAFEDIIMIRGSCDGRRKRVTRVDEEKEWSYGREGGWRVKQEKAERVEGEDRRREVWSAKLSKKKTGEVRLREVKTWVTVTEMRIEGKCKGGKGRCVAGQDADSPLCPHKACPLLH